MLSKYSWLDYAAAVTILIIIYYLYVIARYYREEFKKILSGRVQKPDSDTLQFTSEQEIEDDYIDPEENEEYTEVEQLIERVKTTIEDAAGKRLDTDKIKDYLAVVLRQHPDVASSALRSAINELIVSEAEKYAITLDEGEVDQLWTE